MNEIINWFITHWFWASLISLTVLIVVGLAIVAYRYPDKMRNAWRQIVAFAKPKLKTLGGQIQSAYGSTKKWITGPCLKFLRRIGRNLKARIIVWSRNQKRKKKEKEKMKKNFVKDILRRLVLSVNILLTLGSIIAIYHYCHQGKDWWKDMDNWQPVAYASILLVLSVAYLAQTFKQVHPGQLGVTTFGGAEVKELVPGWCCVPPILYILHRVPSIAFTFTISKNVPEKPGEEHAKRAAIAKTSAERAIELMMQNIEEETYAAIKDTPLEITFSAKPRMEFLFGENETQQKKWSELKDPLDERAVADPAYSIVIRVMPKYVFQFLNKARSIPHVMKLFAGIVQVYFQGVISKVPASYAIYNTENFSKAIRKEILKLIGADDEGKPIEGEEDDFWGIAFEEGKISEWGLSDPVKKKLNGVIEAFAGAQTAVHDREAFDQETQGLVKREEDMGKAEAAGSLAQVKLGETAAGRFIRVIQAQEQIAGNINKQAKVVIGPASDATGLMSQLGFAELIRTATSEPSIVATQQEENQKKAEKSGKEGKEAKK